MSLLTQSPGLTTVNSGTSGVGVGGGNGGSSSGGSGGGSGTTTSSGKGISPTRMRAARDEAMTTNIKVNAVL